MAERNTETVAKARRHLRALVQVGAGLLAIALGAVTTNIVVAGVAVLVAIVLIAKASPTLLEIIRESEGRPGGEFYDPREQRERCACCGCPTLDLEDDTCLLCDWPRDGSAGITLDVARANFRRYLTIYAPDSIPEWMRAPSADVIALKQQLVHRYGEVLSGAEDAGRWFDILDLEADLRSAQYRRVGDDA